MRFSALFAAAIAASPAVVVAGGVLGFALGTKNPDGTCKYQADYEADFDAIVAASGSKIVRGYSASDCNNAEYMLPAAIAKGFQVILGVWPDVESSFNADSAAIQKYLPGNEAALYAITVGSESLYRGTFTGQQLLEKINQVKAMFPGVMIGTADSWNKFADGTADPVITGGTDLLYVLAVNLVLKIYGADQVRLVNAFGYWQGQNIDNATHQYFDDIMQSFQHIQTLANGRNVELWNGETGWPTNGGTNYGAAVAGTQDAAFYFRSAVCGILEWGVNVFYFEAFDEPWKPVSRGDDGQVSDETHWGAMDADRTPKFNLHC